MWEAKNDKIIKVSQRRLSGGFLVTLVWLMHLKGIWFFFPVWLEFERNEKNAASGCKRYCMHTLCAVCACDAYMTYERQRKSGRAVPNDWGKPTSYAGDQSTRTASYIVQSDSRYIQNMCWAHENVEEIRCKFGGFGISYDFLPFLMIFQGKKYHFLKNTSKSNLNQSHFSSRMHQKTKKCLFFIRSSGANGVNDATRSISIGSWSKYRTISVLPNGCSIGSHVNR